MRWRKTNYSEIVLYVRMSADRYGLVLYSTEEVGSHGFVHYTIAKSQARASIRELGNS